MNLHYIGYNDQQGVNDPQDRNGPLGSYGQQPTYEQRPPYDQQGGNGNYLLQLKYPLHENSDNANINIDNISITQNDFRYSNTAFLNNIQKQSMDRNAYLQDYVKSLKKINMNYTFINIIYLLDTTYSMKKNKDIVYSLKNINDTLKSEFKNIQFGFVLYKDLKIFSLSSFL